MKTKVRRTVVTVSAVAFSVLVAVSAAGATVAMAAKYYP